MISLRRLLQAQSYRAGFFSTTALNAISQGLGLAVLTAFAYFFGAEGKTDIYVFVIATVAVTSGIVTNLNAAVIIPESMKLAGTVSPQRSREFLNTLLYIGLGLAAVLSLATLANPVAVFGRLSGFPDDLLVEYRGLLAAMAPLFVFDAACLFIGDIIVSHRIFTVPALLNIVNKLVCLGSIVFFHGALDIYSMAYGLVAAYAVQIAALLYVLRRILKWSFAARWGAVTAQCWRHIGYSLAANTTSSLASFVPHYLISGMEGGVLTALNYAQRLIGAPQVMITHHFSAITGIKLNHLMAARDHAGAGRAFILTNGALLLATTTVAGLLFLNAGVLIDFFEAGAFTAASAALSVLLLRWFTIVLPWQGINALAARLFMAGREIGYAAPFQIAMSLVQAGLLVVCIRTFGVPGYPMGMCIHFMLAAGALYFLIRRVFPFIRYSAVLRLAAQMILIQAVVVGTLTLAWRAAFDPAALHAGLIVSLLYVGLVLILNERLGWSPDARALVRQFVIPRKRA